MKKGYYDTVQISSKYRGEILNVAIFLEKQLDTYIMNYFIGSDKNKRTEFTLFLLGTIKVGFQTKKEIFEHIATTYDADWLKTYKPVREINPESKNKSKVQYHTLFSDLQYIIQQRNMVAHGVLDISKNALEKDLDVITLIRHSDSKSFELTQKEMWKLTYLADAISLFILAKNNSVMQASSSGSVDPSEASTAP